MRGTYQRALDWEKNHQKSHRFKKLKQCPSCG